MSRKFIYIITTVLFITVLAIGLNFYFKIFGNSTIKHGDLYITSTDDFNSLSKKLNPFVKDISNFIWVANKKNFKTPKSGRYVIKENMSHNELVNLLRSGNQTPVKVSFNNQNTFNDFAGRIAQQLEVDSLAILHSFTNQTFLKQNDFNNKTVLQICLPNTYEFYWNVSADNFRKKLLKNYITFWNINRIQKAKKLNLTKNEVITLASIVQKETAKREERPIVVGLYLNRLQKGWPLQADPTIIYAIKEGKGRDYIVKRVLKTDLEINSPYNTYKYRGLPPSQIAMPDINTIDAVLNAENHNYYYMCADIDRIGYHKFAKSLAQHNRNAAKYQNWLNKQGIRR